MSKYEGEIWINVFEDGTMLSSLRRFAHAPENRIQKTHDVMSAKWLLQKEVAEGVAAEVLNLTGMVCTPKRWVVVPERVLRKPNQQTMNFFNDQKGGNP